jgi:hypothetical protein
MNIYKFFIMIGVTVAGSLVGRQINGKKVPLSYSITIGLITGILWSLSAKIIEG